MHAPAIVTLVTDNSTPVQVVEFLHNGSVVPPLAPQRLAPCSLSDQEVSQNLTDMAVVFKPDCNVNENLEANILS